MQGYRRFEIYYIFFLGGGCEMKGDHWVNGVGGWRNNHGLQGKYGTNWNKNITLIEILLGMLLIRAP